MNELSGWGSDGQPAFADAVREGLDAAVVAVAAAVEDGAADAGGLRAGGERLAGLAGLLHPAERAQLRLGPRDGGQRAPAAVVDELGGDAAVGAEHRDPRALGAADDLRADAAAALEAGLWLGDDGHARFPTFRATYSPRSVGRLTRSSSPSCSTLMSRGMRSKSSPFGPWTRTSSGSIATVTPDGTGMGLRPMRDIAGLPDLRHDLAADARLAGLVAGHDAPGRGHDRRPHAAEDLRDLVVADVAALAGARDALEPGDRAAAVVGVLQRHADHLARVVGVRRRDREVADVALLLEDAGHLALEVRGWDLDRLVGGGDPVADARQEVGDGVGH